MKETTGALFLCKKCGKCCSNFNRNRGVFLLAKDIQRLSIYLQVSRLNIITQYCFVTNVDENTIVCLLKSKSGKCIFLRQKLCSVQKAKPTQCKKSPDKLFRNIGYIKSCKGGQTALRTPAKEYSDEFLNELLRSSPIIKRIINQKGGKLNGSKLQPSYI